MLTQIHINNGIQNGQGICFLLTKSPSSPLGIPSGKMITDSEKMSFVYLLDEEEGYGQIHLTQAVWPLMVAALGSDADPLLSLGEGQSIPLTGFREELEMLIFNIEGNNNYGEAFSTAVEQAFAEKLQSIE